MKYELLAKGTQMLAETTTDKKPVADTINEFFEKPAVKATSYVVLSAVVIIGLACLVVVGYKAWSKKQAKKYNNKY